jgi:phage terminase large subunit-like protein
MFQWSEVGDDGRRVSEHASRRTVPATSKLYEGIMAGKIKHDNDPAVNRHMENCILKSDSRGGARLTKDYRNPKLKIDNAIALMMAYDRATARIEEQVVPQFYI